MIRLSLLRKPEPEADEVEEIPMHDHDAVREYRESREEHRHATQVLRRSLKNLCDVLKERDPLPGVK